MNANCLYLKNGRYVISWNIYYVLFPMVGGYIASFDRANSALISARIFGRLRISIAALAIARDARRVGCWAAGSPAAIVNSWEKKYPR